MPKNRPTSQNPESFTWEAMTEPAATAITIVASCSSEYPAEATAAESRPAAVVRATVAEPCAMRRAPAIRKPARISGTPMPVSESARASPMPEVRSTPPNMPPAPVTRITEHTGARAPSMIFSSPSRPPSARRPSVAMATSRVMSSATGVSPIARSTWYQVCSEASPPNAPAVLRVFRPVFIRISSMGSTSRATTRPKAGGFASRSASARPRMAGTGRVHRRPAHRPNRYEVTYQVGTAITRPTSMTRPTLAPNSSEAVTGPGCGGT